MFEFGVSGVVSYTDNRDIYLTKVPVSDFSVKAFRWCILLKLDWPQCIRPSLHNRCDLAPTLAFRIFLFLSQPNCAHNSFDANFLQSSPEWSHDVSGVSQILNHVQNPRCMKAQRPHRPRSVSNWHDSNFWEALLSYFGGLTSVTRSVMCFSLLLSSG